MLGVSGVIAGVCLLVVQNQMMITVNRIIDRLNNIAQGDLTESIPLDRVDELAGSTIL